MFFSLTSGEDGDVVVVYRNVSPNILRENVNKYQKCNRFYGNMNGYTKRYYWRTGKARGAQKRESYVLYYERNALKPWPWKLRALSFGV